MKRPKLMHGSSILGQRGINLIATVVGDMGFMWTPTSGASDAGIDGFVEIRKQDTGEATNLMLQIQSKATGREWESETPDAFDFRCDERDLDYWLQGNAPIILVVSRPNTKEAYWVSIKDYFTELEERKARKIHFDKKRDLFNAEAASALANIAKPKDSGLYLASPPISEQLCANLLPVARYAQRIFIADTEYRERDGVRAKLKEFGVKGKFEWFLKDEKLISFYDLRKDPWSNLCEPSTTREVASDDWALSQDGVTRNDFVRLLGLALRGFLSAKGIWFYQPKNGVGYYFYAPSRDPNADADKQLDSPPTTDVSPRKKELPPKVIRWKLQKESQRTVFRAYYGKKDSARIVYYRHSAFEPKFRRFGGIWFLEITPTYHFTSDGTRLSKYADSYLSGIKRIEKHVAVHGNVRFWGYVLTDRGLFTKGGDFITFADLLEFTTDFGIPETDWLNRADEEEKDRLKEGDEAQILLFDEN